MQANEKGRPGGTGAAKQTNAQNVPQCDCGGQQFPLTRKDVFAAVALHGMLATAQDHKEIFSLCVEHGSATATTCFFIAAKMEFAARSEIGGSR